MKPLLLAATLTPLLTLAACASAPPPESPAAKASAGAVPSQSPAGSAPPSPNAVSAEECGRISVTKGSDNRLLDGPALSQNRHCKDAKASAVKLRSNDDATCQNLLRSPTPACIELYGGETWSRGQGYGLWTRTDTGGTVKDADCICINETPIGRGGP